MGEATAWAGDEAESHGCRGGSEMRIDPMRDGYTITVRRPERVGVFIPGELVAARHEAAIRKLVKQACDALRTTLLENLK